MASGIIKKKRFRKSRFGSGRKHLFSVNASAEELALINFLTEELTRKKGVKTTRNSAILEIIDLFAWEHGYMKKHLIEIGEMEPDGLEYVASLDRQPDPNEQLMMF